MAQQGRDLGPRLFMQGRRRAGRGEEGGGEGRGRKGRRMRGDKDKEGNGGRERG